MDLVDILPVVRYYVLLLWSPEYFEVKVMDLESRFYSFSGKAPVRRATLSCDSCYFSKNPLCHTI